MITNILRDGPRELAVWASLPDCCPGHEGNVSIVDRCQLEVRSITEVRIVVSPEVARRLAAALIEVAAAVEAFEAVALLAVVAAP